MNGPYWMVFFNILFSLLMLLGIVVYQFIYPKKKIKLVVLLVFITILPLISIFRPGVYESGDFQTHVMEEISFYHLLSQGEIYPLWGGDFNATYGYPSFHFTYPLPFYCMAFIHFIGFSFINSIKIFLALTFFFSGFFMYRLLRKEVTEKAAIAGALFYLFAPYHLIDLHFRADVGEVLAFVFLPLCLLTARNFLQTKSVKWFILEILSFAALLLSHPALSLAGYGILSLYILIFIEKQKKDKMKLILLQIGCLISSIIITAFYWLPILLEMRYTSDFVNVHSISYLHIEELLYSPWKFGLLFQGPQGQLAFIIGYVQIILVIFALVFLIKNKIKNSEKPLLIISLLILFVTVFLMLSISKPIWLFIPLLKSFQYAYRLQSILLFTLSIAAAIMLNNIKKDWVIIFICIIMVFSTILNWGNRETNSQITDTDLQKQVVWLGIKGSPLEQAVTLWSDPNDAWAKKKPTNHLEIIKGTGTTKEIHRDNIDHVYLVNAKTQLTVKENTLYFPGWNVFIDYHPQQINILSNTKPKGLISFTIPKGLHKVEVVFKDTFIVALGKIISIFSLIIGTVFFSIFHYINKEK